MSWLALRMILAIMHSVLKASADAQCEQTLSAPLSLCRAHWRFLELSMLRVPCSFDTASGRLQPLASAMEVISAACAVPCLLQEALTLLMQSARERGAHGLETCLHTLEQVLRSLPGTSLEEPPAVNALVQTIHVITDLAMTLPEALQDPAVVKALYSLWTRALALARGQACGGLLRKSLLANLTLVDKLLKLLCITLPLFAADVLLRWLTLLLPRSATDIQAVTDVLVNQLPSLCKSVCTALIEQGSLTKWDAQRPSPATHIYYVFVLVFNLLFVVDNVVVACACCCCGC